MAVTDVGGHTLGGANDSSGSSERERLMRSTLPSNPPRRPRGARRLLVMALVLTMLGLTAAAHAKAAQTTAAPSQTTTSTSPYTFTKTETFGASTWWSTWGLGSAPWHTQMATESGNQ